MELYYPLILDGATGTELQKRGFIGAVCTEQWVLEHPEALQELQGAYIEAGSNIVYAPTFGANRIKLEEHHITGQTSEMNQKLVQVSKEGAAGRALVCADLAPTGKFLYPLGDLRFEELVDIYTEQAAAAEAAGVDLYAVETQMTVPEARAAVLAIRSVSRKPIFVTFTCDATGKTMTGTDVVAALEIFQGMGVDAFGLNCSVGPEDMLVQLKRLQEYAEIPLIAKPNAGMPELEDGKTVYRCAPETFAEFQEAFAEAGVCVFGGCCGTTPEHIRALAEGTKRIHCRMPAPRHTELLPLATEKKLCLLPADVIVDHVLECTAGLAGLLEGEADNVSLVTAIRIESEAQLETFAETQYAIEKPLCLVCEDAALLEQALRLYQGRAMYEGSLPEEQLMPFVKKYGLVI